ncbi:LOW QUALITY PROTEIN: hypothetical protein U9M48_020681 [Paspalum notatum var. saurae]|uniref:Protein kinase domain-containing protein n=1 Tax=Paspalum notatum var. saurae TaxID=547442 RepID=A0AAQ3TDX6_PASNO
MHPLLLLPLLASFLLAPAAATAEQSPGCWPRTCHGLDITYPFWVKEPGGPTCGPSSFQINCTGTGAFLVRSVLQTYQVLNIFTHNKSVHMVDHFLPLDTGCPAPIANISFPTADLITSKANEELLFLGKCTESKPANSTGFHSLPCDNSSYVRLGDGRDFSSHGIPGGVPPSCLFVVIPIRWDPDGNGTDYLAGMRNGFLLEWTDVPEDCPRCMESGGECVYSPGFNCNCSGSLEHEVCVGVNISTTSMKIGIAGGVVGCVFLVCVVIFLWHKHKREPLPFLLCKKIGTAERNIEALILSYGSLAPKRYKFSEAIKITSSLNNKLGEGSYGMVFKGKLDDGRLVAVKFLHDSKGEGEEFVNEVMSIGRTSHVNIVGLFGFCLEGSKRALIYEYMPNGSLDRYIYSENPKAVLGWDKLYMIAIGIARGLEYLHYSCNTRIVHFDIKPQNILLDQDFHPKIADFGLAKLCRTKESKLSMIGARGTVGFIAPEVHSRTFGVVSTKSDVYSYGMMLLEMVGGRKNVKSVAQKSSENYFPHWIYDHFGQDDALDACEVTSGNEGIAKKMSVIGLWCIQILPMHRPTITKVLEMFERGLNDLDMPPRQNFSQILEDPAYGLNAESSSMSYAAAEDGQSLCPPALCGDVNISFPFGIVPDHATETSCAELGFQTSKRLALERIPYLAYRSKWSTACFILMVCYKHKRKLPLSLCKKSNNSERNIEALIVSYGSLAPKRYKYSEAIKITSSLNNKLGEGSYGMVFKGKLDDGRLVAVKFLHGSKGEGEEFVNKVMSIGRTSHVNIVGLFGFCLEGSKRASIVKSSSVPLMLEAAAAAAAEDGRSLCQPALCGDVNISFPFGIVADHATASACGEFEFQVACFNNTTPYLGHNKEHISLQILDIFYDNYSLLVTDVPKVQTFNTFGNRSCHISMSSNTSSKVPPPAAREGLVETVCGNDTFVRVADEPSNRSGGYYGSYFMEGCNATVVPVIGGYGNANASNYKELIADGFLLTWNLPALPPLPQLPVMVFTSTSFTLACLIWIMYRRREKYTVFIQNYTVNVSSIEEILRGYHSLVPKRYKYSELKKITGSFKDRLGEGGYGMVFKGKLEDGHKVAVKLLKGSKGNGEEFMNEVISIRGTSHVNIVNLLGFCLHGPTIALIYEYMVNGSLDKYIYSEESKMIIGWEKLKQIAIGIARGLEYLHRGCNTRIIHFDIKPHNILLDEDFCPKIADFGLAKLCHLKDSALSMAEARGTIGFIAPEVFSRGVGVVSTKSDVYSYGMMLLEMVGGRKSLIQHTENSSNAYFPNCAYDRLMKDLQGHEVMCETEEIERQMTLVGLWCIQTAPGNRPSMSRVIEMLEKNVNELEMPLKPFLSCPSEAPWRETSLILNMLPQSTSEANDWKYKCSERAEMKMIQSDDYDDGLIFFFSTPRLDSLLHASTTSLLMLPMAPWPLLFFVSLVLMMALLSAAANGQAGERFLPVLCGNVSIVFPLGIIPEQAMDPSCGGTGFQVRCANNTPYLGYSRREHWFQILDIFYGNASLLVADVHKLEGFSSSGGSNGCHISTNSTPGHLGLPFSISPVNQNLIFYNCTTKAPELAAPVVVAGEGLVETKCRNNMFVRVGGHYDGESSSYGSYFMEGCDAAVVPVLGRPGRMNASSYEELISDGFLLTWQLPPGSPSAGILPRHRCCCCCCSPSLP